MPNLNCDVPQNVPQDVPLGVSQESPDEKTIRPLKNDKHIRTAICSCFVHFAVIFKFFTYDCKILCVCRFKIPNKPLQALYKNDPHYSKSLKAIDLYNHSDKKSK